MYQAYIIFTLGQKHLPKNTVWFTS